MKRAVIFLKRRQNNRSHDGTSQTSWNLLVKQMYDDAKRGRHEQASGIYQDHKERNFAHPPETATKNALRRFTLKTVVRLSNTVSNKKSERSLQETLTLRALTILANLSIQYLQWTHSLQVYDALCYRNKPPSAEAVAYLANPENVHVMMEWAEDRDIDVSPATILGALGATGGWATALEVAQYFEKKCAYRESYSLGVLLPFVAAGGHWRQAINVLRSAIQCGALCDKILVQHLIHSTATPQAWHSCLAMTACLSSVHMTDDITEWNTWSRVIDICPDWEAACNALNLAQRASLSPLPSSVLKGLIPKLESANRWREAAHLSSLSFYTSECKEHRGSTNRSGLLHTQNNNTVLAIEPVAAQTHVPPGSSFNARSLGFLVNAIRAAHASIKRLSQRDVSDCSWPVRENSSCPRMSGMAINGTCESRPKREFLHESESNTSLLLRLCHQEGQWAAAMGLGALAYEKNIRLDEATHAALVYSCATGGHWESALYAHRAMALDAGVADLHSGVCTAVLRSCMLAGRWAAATAFFEGLQRLEPRVVISNKAYNIVCEAYVRRKWWLKALQVTAEQVRMGLQPSDEVRNSSLYITQLGPAFHGLAGGVVASVERFVFSPRRVKKNFKPQMKKNASFF